MPDLHAEMTIAEREAEIIELQNRIAVATDLDQANRDQHQLDIAVFVLLRLKAGFDS